MNASSQPLRLHGVPFSQPVRAVIWLMLHKGLAFDLVPVSPGSKNDGGSRSPAYLARNPAGTIPMLGESHAILCYLANRHGWHDVYPTEPQARARVDWYLHYHHRNVREGSIGLVAPRIRKDLNFPEAVLQTAQAIFNRALRTLETGWLAQSRFIAGDQVTLADFSAYAEIGQLQAGFLNLFDFTPHANLSRWLDAMRAVRGHDDAHLVLSELGDISGEAPSMDRIRDANLRAFKRLANRSSV
jgi:glutathione S-transferase